MPPRKRRNPRELFVDKLKKLSNGEQKLIGNLSLREALGWDEDKYHRIRIQLRDNNVIIVGSGRGRLTGAVSHSGFVA